MKNFVKNNEVAIVIAGLILGLVGFISFLHGFTDKAEEKMVITWISIPIMAVIFWIYYLYYKIRQQNIQNKILSEAANTYKALINDLKGRPKTKFERFETIKSNGVLKYGFVNYKPFFWTEESLNHKGIGKELLTEIFGSGFRLQPYEYPIGKAAGHWKDIFIDLCKKPNPKFDIIITPLFETRSRLYNFDIAYCSPIFYSNIGIYIRTDLFDGKKRSFKEAIHYIKSSGLKPEVLIGELSETLVQKYFSDYTANENDDNKEPASDDDFIKVLQNINNNNPVEKRNNNLGDFAFMEVFKANSIINKWGSHQKFNLSNILKDNELMYPVSFVVRKEDTVLRNLINVRLIELRENGQLEKIMKRVASEIHINDDAEFNNIFIQKYDFKNLSV